MNVTFVLTHLSHQSPGSFYRPYDIAKNLKNLGTDVKILTPFREDVEMYSDVPLTELQNFGTNLKIKNYTYNSVRKILKISKISQITPYDKFLTSWSEGLAERIEKSIHNTPDILQGEQEAASLASIKVGKKMGIPTVADFHNIWPEVLAASGYIKLGGDIFRNLMKIEQYIVENADGIIAISDFMKEYLINNFNADAKRITIIPPGGDILFENSEELPKIEDQKSIIFSGLVHPYAHVDLFVKSIPSINARHPNTKFIISEKGSEVKNIKKLCETLSIKPDFYWFKSRRNARNLLEKCYTGVITSANDFVRKIGPPLKLVEYMSLGIPIIANDIGSWCKIINDEKIGILTGDDPQEFADGICTLIEDEKLHNQIRKRMIKLMEKKFNWKTNIEQILIPFYQKIIS